MEEEQTILSFLINNPAILGIILGVVLTKGSDGISSVIKYIFNSFKEKQKQSEIKKYAFISQIVDTYFLYFSNNNNGLTHLNDMLKIIIKMKPLLDSKIIEKAEILYNSLLEIESLKLKLPQLKSNQESIEPKVALQDLVDIVS